MTLKELAGKLNLELRTEGADLSVEVVKGYASDLLSDVMGNAPDGAVWVTLQIHENIVAVASIKSLAAIFLVNRREPDPATLERARAEGVAIFVSDLSAFDLAGRLFEMGLRGH